MRWGSGEIELKPQNPNPQHLKPVSYLLNTDSENTDSETPDSETPNPMVDVGFLQEFYFLTKISKNYLLTAKLENI